MKYKKGIDAQALIRVIKYNLFRICMQTTNTKKKRENGKSKTAHLIIS